MASCQHLLSRILQRADGHKVAEPSELEREGGGRDMKKEGGKGGGGVGVRGKIGGRKEGKKDLKRRGGEEWEGGKERRVGAREGERDKRFPSPPEWTRTSQPATTFLK